MEAKEKAIDLRFKFWQMADITPEQAKQCALIAVDEILCLCWNGNETALEYWKQVKQEIQKL